MTNANNTNNTTQITHDETTHQGRAARFMAQHGGQRCEQLSDDRVTRVWLGDCCHDFHESGAVTTYDVRFGDEDTTTYVDFLAQWDTVA